MKKIQTLEKEASKAQDPLEQQEQFDKFQQADNTLNSMFEAQRVTKKELRDF
jgi:hypothetical protein